MPAKKRPAAEVEVTPDMIKAGALALVSSDRRIESDADIAERIFRVMLKASRGTSFLEKEALPAASGPET